MTWKPFSSIPIAFLEGTDFEDVIRTAVSLGGDCDTLTCIAGSIAEAFYGIPDEMITECRNALANCPVKPEFRLSYTVSDPEAAKNELLGKAVTDAKEKASVLTQAAGVTLKDIQSIDYSWGKIEFECHPINRMLMEDDCLAAPMTAKQESYNIDIEPDDIEASDTVTVLWEIG